MNSQPNLPLERQLISILASNHEDAYGTQRQRAEKLSQAARVIVEKFGLQKWDNLKQKHVQYLVDHWKEVDTGRRTIDGKLSHFRWLLGKIGKPNLLPRGNAELGIESGPRYTRAGKTVSDDWFAQKLEAVSEPRIQVMMLLARYIGLRFEEASLFRPWIDWNGERVWIKRGSKGGRPRYLFLHNANQAEVLKLARSMVTKERGMIPAEYPTYKNWREDTYKKLRAIGIGRKTDVIFHDIRRTFIVERMDYLITVKQMDEDHAARLVAREVGHSRTEVLRWYLDWKQK